MRKGRALESLRRGMQGMAQQMQQMQQGDGQGNEQAGDQPGQGNPQGNQQAGQRDNDPLGRPMRNRDYSDGRVEVPGANESPAQRAQRILEELRRKLGDPDAVRRKSSTISSGCCAGTDVAQRLEPAASCLRRWVRATVRPNLSWNHDE